MASKILDIILRGKDQFSPAAKSASASAKGLKNELSDADKQANFSFKQQNKDWRKSEAYAFMKQVKGAGAAAAVTFLAKEFANATENAAEMVSKWKEGKVTGMDMANSFADMVPVVGKVWTTMYKAGSTIDDMFTGNKHKKELLRYEDELWNIGQKNIERNQKLQEESGKESADIAEKNARQLKLIGLDGFALDKQKFNNQTQDEIKALEKRRDQRIEAIDEGTKKTIEDMQKNGTDENGKPIDKSILAKQIQRVKDQAEAAKVKIGTDTSKEIIDNEATRKALAEDMERKHQEALNEFVRKGTDERAALETSAGAYRLMEQNRGFEAELAQQEAATEKKKDVLRRELEKMSKGETDARIKQLQENERLNEAAIDKEAGAKKETTFAKTLESEKLARLDLLASLGDANAKFEADRIRKADDYIRKYYELKAIIDRTSDPAKKKDAQAEQDQLKENQKKVLDKNLKDSRTAFLEEQARYGTVEEKRNATKELARQQMMEDFEQQKAAYENIIKSNFTQEQKDAAANQLQDWSTLAASRYDSMSGMKEEHLRNQVSLNSNLLMSGGGKEISEGYNSQQLIAKNSTEGVKIQTEIKKGIQELVNHFKNLQPVGNGITRN